MCRHDGEKRMSESDLAAKNIENHHTLQLRISKIFFCNAVNSANMLCEKACVEYVIAPGRKILSEENLC